MGRMEEYGGIWRNMEVEVPHWIGKMMVNALI